MNEINQAKTKLQTLETWRKVQTTLTHKTLIDREIRETRAALDRLRRQRLASLKRGPLQIERNFYDNL